MHPAPVYRLFYASVVSEVEEAFGNMKNRACGEESTHCLTNRGVNFQTNTIQYNLLGNRVVMLIHTLCVYTDRVYRTRDKNVLQETGTTRLYTGVPQA